MTIGKGSYRLASNIGTLMSPGDPYSSSMLEQIDAIKSAMTGAGMIEVSQTLYDTLPATSYIAFLCYKHPQVELYIQIAIGRVFSSTDGSIYSQGGTGGFHRTNAILEVGYCVSNKSEPPLSDNYFIKTKSYGQTTTTRDTPTYHSNDLKESSFECVVGSDYFYITNNLRVNTNKRLTEGTPIKSIGEISMYEVYAKKYSDFIFVDYYNMLLATSSFLEHATSYGDVATRIIRSNKLRNKLLDNNFNSGKYIVAETQPIETHVYINSVDSDIGSLLKGEITRSNFIYNNIRYYDDRYVCNYNDVLRDSIYDINGKKYLSLNGRAILTNGVMPMHVPLTSSTLESLPLDFSNARTYLVPYE